MNCRIWMAFLWACITIEVWAQPQNEVNKEGVKFENLTWGQALQKAQDTGRKVFVDCYTQSCVPCKYMARMIFPQEACGSYFSPRFVSLMRDMEAEGEGVTIAKKYNVRVYPTYLILNPDGTLCYELNGSAKTVELFLSRMETEELIYSLQLRYDAGEREESFLNEYLFALRKGRDTKRYQTILGNLWGECDVETLCDSIHWNVIAEDVKSAEHPLFRKVLTSRVEFMKFLGEETVMNKIFHVYEEELKFYKLMDLDFGLRVEDLYSLEKEYPEKAAPLRYGMRFRQIINGQLEKEVETLFPLLEEVNTLQDSSKQASILSNLQGIDKLANAEQCNRLYQELQKISARFTASQKQSLTSLMNRLKSK